MHGRIHWHGKWTICLVALALGLTGLACGEKGGSIPRTMTFVGGAVYADQPVVGATVSVRDDMGYELVRVPNATNVAGRFLVAVPDLTETFRVEASDGMAGATPFAGTLSRNMSWADGKETPAVVNLVTTIWTAWATKTGAPPPNVEPRLREFLVLPNARVLPYLADFLHLGSQYFRPDMFMQEATPVGGVDPFLLALMDEIAKEGNTHPFYRPENVVVLTTSKGRQLLEDISNGGFADGTFSGGSALIGMAGDAALSLLAYAWENVWSSVGVAPPSQDAVLADVKEAVAAARDRMSTFLDRQRWALDNMDEVRDELLAKVESSGIEAKAKAEIEAFVNGLLTLDALRLDLVGTGFDSGAGEPPVKADAWLTSLLTLVQEYSFAAAAAETSKCSLAGLPEGAIPAATPPSCEADIEAFARIAAGIDADGEPLSDTDVCEQLQAGAAATLLGIHAQIDACATAPLEDALEALHKALVPGPGQEDGLIWYYAGALVHGITPSADKPEEALAEAFAALDAFVFTSLRIQVAGYALIEGVDVLAFDDTSKEAFAAQLELFADRATEQLNAYEQALDYLVLKLGFEPAREVVVPEVKEAFLKQIVGVYRESDLVLSALLGREGSLAIRFAVEGPLAKDTELTAHVEIGDSSMGTMGCTMEEGHCWLPGESSERKFEDGSKVARIYTWRSSMVPEEGPYELHPPSEHDVDLCWPSKVDLPAAVVELEAKEHEVADPASTGTVKVPYGGAAVLCP